MSLEISSIYKHYGAQEVLHHIDLKIEKGQIVGFLGPNGAGKSTLMKIIMAYVQPDQGKVLLDGLDVQKNPLQARQLIGYLPEHNPLYLDMYVRESLEFTAQLYGLGKKGSSTAAGRKQLLEKVDQMIEKTGLTPEAHKKIGQLSKGYRQRVGLAQAMIHDPQILILDEPTTGLDPNQLVEIRELIQAFGQDKTVLFSTHIMQEVTAICDRYLVLKKGQLVADAPVNNLSAEQLEEHFRQLTQ